MKQNEIKRFETEEAIERCDQMLDSMSVNHAIGVGFRDGTMVNGAYIPTFTGMKILLLTCKDALEKQVPKTPVNIQGIPVWGYCPSCGQVVKQLHDHTGCSNCLQRLNWNESEVV